MIAFTHKPSPVRVLIVDDMPSIHEDYAKILKGPAMSALDVDAAWILGETPSPVAAMPFALDSAFQGQEALALVQRALAEQRPYTLAFVDMRMPPGWNGVETIRHLWAADPRLQIVICTAYSDFSWSATIKELGESDNLIILKKPFDHIEVQQLAHALARKWLLAREVEGRLADLDAAVRERTAELRLAEDGFAQVFDASPLLQAIVALDTGEILAINGAFERATGLSRNNLAGLTPETFGHGIDPSRWRALLAKLLAGEPVDEYPFTYAPTQHVRRDMRGSARFLQYRGRPCSVWVIREVTEELRLEEQARQSQKMDAIGQLAAGVAHDFNNLLTGINGFTEQALLETNEPTTRQLLEPVKAAGQRAASLTRQLLVFSRKQATQPEITDLGVVLRELQPMLHRILGEHLELRWEIPDTLPWVLADIANVEQVVVNLALNARDACPAAGGVIRIAASHVTELTPPPGTNVANVCGGYVAIRVTDNGCGIPADVLPRIFEPFFTTKDVGKGTGLGLSTAYSIVRQHGGWIDVQSTPNQGSTFSVYQPVASPDTTPLPPLTDLADLDAPILARPRVLLVEDDPAVQSVLEVLFVRQGFESVSAPDGAAALRIWEEQKGNFGLLVTDMVMPSGCNGLELARILRERDPDLKVIVMTGYSADLLQAEQFAMPGPAPRLLFKPFELRDVLAAIAKA